MAAYSGNGSLGVLKSDADIPSLSGTFKVSAVGRPGNEDGLVGELDLSGRVALNGWYVGTSCWSKHFAGCLDGPRGYTK